MTVRALASAIACRSSRRTVPSFGSLRRLLVPFLAAALGAAPPLRDAQAQAAQPSGITGRVTDAASGQPVASAQVAVVGTTLGAQTNEEGRYTIRGVSPGTVEVRVLRVGFGQQRQPVTVAAGQVATLDIQMQAVATTLNPVVTTATGQQRRVEVGNAIARVDAAEVVATRPVANVADLLTARAAGVQVLPGNQTGAGSRVRIRGTSSISLSNDPIYVIDGVRVESTTRSSSIGVGGTQPSRVGDLNPEEIESIEVVRGPSAATLYGTDAANGVIVIRTKRGTAGRPQWTAYTEQGVIQDRNSYPDSYRAWRTGPTAATTSTPANGVQCFLTDRARGACAQDSVTTFNVFEDEETTPYGTGRREQYGLQVGGGSEAVRYFLHGEWEGEDGVTKIPDFDVRTLDRQGVGIRPEWANPNALTRITGRANLNVTLPRNAEVALNVGYVSLDQRLPTSDDAGASGIGANAFGGLGYKYNTSANGTDTLYGYRQFTPRDIYQQTTTQAVERMIGALNGNWQPREWLALRGNFGLDYTNRLDTQLCRFANCPDVGTDRLGFKRDNRTNLFVYTVDAGASGTFQVTPAISSRTTVGAQFYRNIFDRNGAQGLQLPPGATTVTAGAVQLADEATSESRTLGAYVEENVAIRDRLFLTAGVRSDRNSAFGADFKTVFYPKVAASWVVSEEPFFPQGDWLNQLRLRTAYGASGVQPGTIDAVQYFATQAARVEGAETRGVVFSAVGNPDLKPERSTELEVGVDGTFWNSRLTTEFTYYNKSSRDALVERVLPPSLGVGLTTNATATRFENLGEVRNSGFEALVNAQLVQRDAFGWDVTLNGSTNSNELVDLGGLPTIVTSSSIRQVEGYPLNGYWSPRLRSFADADGNRIITLDEIVVDSTPSFHGYSLPRHEVSFTNGFELWNRRLRLATMLDYKGGHKLYFNSERIRCSSRLNCQGIADPNAPLFEQARAVALREHPTRTVAGYFEDADFIRLREVAFTFTAPTEWAQTFRGRSLSATLAARNVGILWTKYGGVDPESNFSTGDTPSDFQAAAPPSYLTFRLNLGF